MPHRVDARRASTTTPPGTPRVADRAEDLAPYLEDAAHYPGGHATAVAHPASEGEVAALLQGAERILAVGAQSSLTGGATPMGELVVATNRLDRITATGPRHITVEAGVSLQVLRAALAERGAFYPPVPTFDGACAGGVVATNAAGAATFKYGSTRDWVRGLTVVLADGSVLDLERGMVHAHPEGYFEVMAGERCTRVPVPDYQMPRVAKRSAGYFAESGMDLVDLFIGSEGTLGIVTTVTFEVLPRQPAVCLAWLTIPDERAGLDLVGTLRKEAHATWRSHDPRGLDVAAVEHIDRESLSLLREDGAERTHDVQLPSDTAIALLVQIELPPDSVPTSESAFDQLAGALTSDAEDTPLIRLSRLIAHAGLLDRAEIVLPHQSRRQQQLLALREAVPEAVNRRIGEARRLDPGVHKTAADMIVRFDRFAHSLKVFRQAFDRRSLRYAIWGHISDGNVHPNVIPRTKADVASGQHAILECGREIIAMGGCPLAEHGVGRNPIKQSLLRALYGDRGIRQMQRVKGALDPLWKLAPGVLFPVATPPVGSMP